MVLDGGTATSFTPSSTPASQTNDLIFASDTLQDGNHTLLVTAGTSAPIWVDYFLITPGTLSPDTSTSSVSKTTPTNVAIVDDQNPLIVYSGSWNRAGSSQEFDGTTSWSATQGSSLSFTFVGASSCPLTCPPR